MGSEGGRAAIREARATDAPQMAAIYAPFVTGAAVSFELDPPDAEEMAARIARAEDSHPWLVCAHGDELLGYAYASGHRDRAAYQWAVEVSVYVREESRRGGVARGLYVALLELARLQGRCVALAGIALPNPASVGFHEALGFERVAVYPNIGHKLGAWHAVGWWQRDLGELPGAPADPATLSTLRDTPGFAAAIAAGDALLPR